MMLQGALQWRTEAVAHGAAPFHLTPAPLLQEHHPHFPPPAVSSRGFSASDQWVTRPLGLVQSVDMLNALKLSLPCKCLKREWE